MWLLDGRPGFCGDQRITTQSGSTCYSNLKASVLLCLKLSQFKVVNIIGNRTIGIQCSKSPAMNLG